MSDSDSPKSRSQKPVSEKQLAANRANAARSTGPTSATGKTRSSQNSRKHGFASANFTVVRLEDIEEVACLRADLIACYQPVNSQELFALERMALCQQAILRAARLEAGLFTSCMNESFGPEGAPSLPFRQEMAEGVEITRALNRNFILADGFQLLARQGNSIPLMLRYQAQAERLYRRAVEEFERLRKLRPELPDEPVSGDDEPAQPEENTTSAPLSDASPNEPIPSPALRPGPHDATNGTYGTTGSQTALDCPDERNTV
jgi:hypothetical protein